MAIPEHLVGTGEPSRYGWNWSTDGDDLNIDTLNFGDRDLAELNATLSGRRGRRITSRDLRADLLVLEGRDDDARFVIRVERKDSQTRGLSVVHSERSSKRLAPVVSRIVSSFVAFPAEQASPQAPAAVVEPPTPPTPATAIDGRIQELEQKLAKLRQLEEERAHREAADAERKEAARRLEEERERMRVEEQERAEAEKREIRERLDALRKSSERALAVATLPSHRIAMVVGIDSYLALPPLSRAVNDARAVASALTLIGFEVIEAVNIDGRQFYERWYEFLNRVDAGGVAAFYFAGHGVQIEGRNYLLPSNSPNIEVRPGVLMRQSIDFDSLRHELKDRRPGVTLFVLDACRNNPYVSQIATRAAGRARLGLAPVEAARGTFIMYSADPGEEALDRLPDDPPSEKNSLYTRHLMAMLADGRLSLQNIALRLRSAVRAAAGRVNHAQTPAYYDGLVGPVCLNKDCREANSSAN